MYFGGALDLANGFFKKYNFIAFPACNTGSLRRRKARIL
jgi:hypothetical protein